MTVNDEFGAVLQCLDPTSVNHSAGVAVNMSQRDPGGIRRITRRGLGETQKADDHKGDLLFLGIAVTDHCGLDLSWCVGVDGDVDSAEGGEEHSTRLGEDEARFGVAPTKPGFDRRTVGGELGDDGGEPPIEIGQSHRVFHTLRPDDPERLEMGPVATRCDQRPAGGPGSGINA